MHERTVYAILAAIIIIGGFGVGISISVASFHVPVKTDSLMEVGVYHLDLVEIMDVSYNSTAGSQPKYYVVENGSLESSANISLPSHVRIQVTIVSYDMANASVDPQYLKVIGTVGGVVTVINGSIASMANTSMKWSQNMSLFNASQVLHTFTIFTPSSTLLNIPVIAGDTETASFYLNSTGTLSWQCEAACGSGPDGWGASMDTSGWMEGTVSVY